MLAVDGQRYPTFAVARRVTVMTWVEAFDAAFPALIEEGVADGSGAQRLLDGLHTYEAHRGNGPVPHPDANSQWAGVNDKWIVVYERERAVAVNQATTTEVVKRKEAGS